MVSNQALVGVLTGVVILLMINVDERYFGQVDAVGGEFVLSQMMRRVNLNLNSGKHKSPLDKWRAENERLMREAYKVIDSYLELTIEQDDLDSNIVEVRRLLDDIRDGGIGLPFRKPKKKTSFIKWQISKPESLTEVNIMRSALLSLTHLRGNRSPVVDCSSYTTQQLAESNRIAMDPIGRRERGDEDLLPRIDQLIFVAVLQRAEHCLPKYKEQLLLVSAPSERNFEVMRTYWNEIFEHRMKQRNFGGGKPIDEIFLEYPKTALELVKAMPNALEADELGIGKEIFNNQASSSWDVPRNGTYMGVYNFNKFVMTSCDDYIAVVRGIIESLEFDLRLSKFIPEQLVQSIDHNSEVNKNRAYFSMCGKAILESDRIKRLLERGTEGQ